MTKKITLATIKSFIRKNQENLFIDCRSSFNGMIDCVQTLEDSGTFKKTEYNEEKKNTNTLGVSGMWAVLQSGDRFTPYDDGQFVGYGVYNCCGNNIIATKK